MKNPIRTLVQLPGITLAFVALLLFPTMAFSQTATELFMKVPSDALPASPESRAKMIIDSKDDLLKFRTSEERRGEVKIFSQAKGETLIGMAIDNCESSDLKFWKVKGNKWKLVTKSVIKPLGARDIAAILEVSPTTVVRLNQTLAIAYFYNFLSDSTSIELFARRAESCDVAGKVYDYKFNGKMFVIAK